MVQPTLTVRTIVSRVLSLRSRSIYLRRYTIIVLFALQGNRIVHNVGSVFRIFVPLILVRSLRSKIGQLTDIFIS
jgi:ACR3 family arsenite efflux pump ArsB